MIDFRNIAHLTFEAVGEFLYPTRCIFCDMPGSLICNSCIKALPLIDQNLACPRCGAPFGKLTCTECASPGTLDKDGKLLPPSFPFVQARAACSYDGVARRLITTYKDGGEQRLSTYIASLICNTARVWQHNLDALVCVPANKKHARQRGFDHMELIANQCSQWLELPQLHALQSAKSFDQRELSLEERIKNKEGSMHVKNQFDQRLPANILLIDDVFTTGATLVAATNALLKGGACRVFVAVCARVW